MKYTPTVLFPGILLGVLTLIFLTGLISSPTLVEASALEAAQDQHEPAGDISCSLPPSYPDSIRQWCNWIESYANQNGLEARLIAAVMLQESGGNAQAYSHSGAVGLMQVMPRDGIAASFMCANGPCFSQRPSMDELFNPEYNISYGATMLAGLVNKYGNARDALRAYGPMDVGYYYADIVLQIYENYR